MHREILIVKSANPPTVEIDTSVSAVYIRFKSGNVDKTISADKPGIVVTIDLNSAGDVLGIELIGVKEFGIQQLLKLTPVKTPNVDLDRTRYVGSGRALVAA